jgi:low affinity Fe/Cu permease
LLREKSTIGRSNDRTSKGGLPVGLVLLIILIVLLIGSVPAWPYSRGWGYYPSGGVGLVLLILIILLLTGRL